MANASTTGFGFRPIKKVGQTDNNAGLGEYPVAASSAIYNQARSAMVQLTAEQVVVAAGGHYCK